MQLQGPQPMDIQSASPDNKKTAQKDRRTLILPIQRSVFPYNCIVSIQFKEKIPEYQESVVYSTNATGFLISSDLVLTSSHNFFRVDYEKSQIIELTPFSIEIQESEVQGAPTNRELKRIKDVKTNLQYFNSLSQIVILKSLINKEDTDNQSELKFKERILPLEIESVKQDFALIKLQEAVKRQVYFTLCPDLRDKIEATVTGYSEINKLEPELFTHSNSIDSINDNALFYDIDASASQRGSPVYIVEEGQIKAVGIHKAFSSNKNLSYATMINEQMINVLQVWAEQINSSFTVINANQPIIAEQNQEQANALLSMRQKQLKRAYQEQLLKKQQAKLAEEQKRMQKALLYNTRGIQCYEHGNFYQALQYYRRSINIYERMNNKSSSCAATLHNLALANYRENKFKQAVKYYKESLSMRESLEEGGSIDCADTLHNLGLAHKQLNQINGALHCFLRSLSIKQNEKGQHSIDCVNTLNAIGRIYDIIGNLAEALEYFNRQLNIREVINGKDSIDCISVLECIAIIYKKIKEQEKAAEFWKRAEGIKALKQ